MAVFGVLDEKSMSYQIVAIKAEDIVSIGEVTKSLGRESVKLCFLKKHRLLEEINFNSKKGQITAGEFPQFWEVTVSG